MANKQLSTRIALKYDSYANWTSESLGADKGAFHKLLPGEIGLCEIQTKNADAQVAPTVLFKVGAYKRAPQGDDAGELYTFKELPWASAKAADVYSWAKAETVDLEEKENAEGKGTGEYSLVFKTGSTVIHSVDLTSAFADVKSRLATIEANLGSTGEIGKSIDDILDRLDVIQGTASTTGAIDAAIETAKDYTDAQLGNYTLGKEGEDGYKAADGIRKEIEDAKAAALSASDVVAGDLSAHIATKSGNPHEVTKLDVGLGDVDNLSADALKDRFAGDVAKGEEGFAKGGDVHTAVEAAKSYADGIVDTLKKGDVADNAADIEKLTGEVNKIKVFFANADADGEDTEGGKTLYDALDTLKEIQDFINNEASAADQMIINIGKNAENISKNAEDIKDIHDLVKEGGDLEKRVADAESEIENLQLIVSTGDDANSKLREDIASLQDIVTKGDKSNNSLYTALGGLTTRTETLETAVEDPTTGLANTYTIATTANNTANTAKKAAEDNAAAIEEIQNDYLKEADFMILCCGDSQTITPTE